MAGPDVKVYIPATVIAQKPQAWDLLTPKAAVRSYLDWTSYAFRTGNSSVATPTMTPAEEVRVDAAIQYGLENQKLTNQEITSLTFGGPIKRGASVLLPAKEQWKYEYRSVAQGNGVIGGPYEVSYDSTYTVVRNKKGKWIVSAVQVTQTGGTLK